MGDKSHELIDAPSFAELQWETYLWVERREENRDFPISWTPIYPIPTCPWSLWPAAWIKKEERLGTLRDFDTELRSFLSFSFVRWSHEPLAPQPLCPSQGPSCSPICFLPSYFSDTPLEVSRPTLGAYSQIILDSTDSCSHCRALQKNSWASILDTRYISAPFCLLDVSLTSPGEVSEELHVLLLCPWGRVWGRTIQPLTFRNFQTRRWPGNHLTGLNVE